MSSESTPVSGMTIDGVAVPLHIEAEGGDVLEQFLQDSPSASPAAVVETASIPSAPDEGAAS